jgi:hypothetical protein
MHWTDDIPEFKQTMFEFNGDVLREADKLTGEICKMLIDKASCPAVALATFVLLIGDFIAANVDPERWEEALTSVGLLTNAALARVGLEHGLLKIGPKHVH